MFKNVIAEFREFIARGNVIDLAVAVVIGAAFGAVVTSFTNDVLGQLLAAIGGKPDFSDLVLPLRTMTDDAGVTTEIGLRYGAFLTAIVNFLIVGVAMFLVVKAFNHLQNLRKGQDAEEETETELDVLKEIRDALSSRG